MRSRMRHSRCIDRDIRVPCPLWQRLMNSAGAHCDFPTAATVNDVRVMVHISNAATLLETDAVAGPIWDMLQLHCCVGWDLRPLLRLWALISHRANPVQE